MRRVLMLLALPVVAACTREPYGPPDQGATEGEIHLSAEGDLSPNERVTIHVEADNPDGLTGGICFTLFQWHGGWGPEIDWVIDARHDRSIHINSVEAACPALGVTLPTTFMFTVPDLEKGTWMLHYRSIRGDGERPEDRPEAEYIFEVD